MLEIQPTQQQINLVLCGDTKLHKQPISTSHYGTVLLLSLLLFAGSLLMLIAFLLRHVKGVLSMPYLTIQASFLIRGLNCKDRALLTARLTFLRHKGHEDDATTGRLLAALWL